MNFGKNLKVQNVALDIANNRCVDRLKTNKMGSSRCPTFCNNHIESNIQEKLRNIKVTKKTKMQKSAKMALFRSTKTTTKRPYRVKSNQI